MSDESFSKRQNDQDRFAPSRFMRSRRPHLFSDSIDVTEYGITRETLSYHLETLTNRKEETEFEEFARRLAQKFISPNLRPQTGPTGGGDGKTDTETYPVVSSVAERWFVPDIKGAHERWAFAFSAKKDWKTKLKLDVTSIISTNRGYTRIYFITNQFVSSRESTAAQDRLVSQFGVSVTILDRMWLLDRVFEHDSLDIAIKCLGLDAGTAPAAKRKTGPRDFERSSELAALEADINDGSKYVGKLQALAEDCIRAARLARGLEKSRFEVEGRYQRAIRISREHGLQAQEIAATYELAWTANFWFDDFATLNSLYDDLERLVIETSSAEDFERLTNLLPLIRTSARYGGLTIEAAKLEERSGRLLATLKKISQETSRPNNALHAHALMLLAHLAAREDFERNDELDKLWNEFREVLSSARNLGTFPFESIAETLTELGEFVPESNAFDCLYEEITDALALRRSEGEAAQKNTQRAFQKLGKGLPYEAIRWFGRAVGLLVKVEYEDQLVDALMGSSFAFEQAGLLWASRNYALAATSQQFSAYMRTGSLTSLNPAVLARHFWTECRLGRIPHIISAYEWGAIAQNARPTTDAQREIAFNRRAEQSSILGSLLLKTAFSDLPRINRLPDALERLGIDEARMALLFLLGREDTLRLEGTVPPEATSEGYEGLFQDWYASDVAQQMPDQPSYLLDDKVELRSHVLGCELRVECNNNLTSLGIAEALLGAIEALLATSLAHNFLPILDILTLRVCSIEHAPLVPKLQFVEESGVTIGIVSHAQKLIYATKEDALSFPEWLKEAVMQVFTRFALPSDLENWADTVLRGENAFDRALTFSIVPSMYSVLFGDRDRLSIDEWIEEADLRYDVARSIPWKPTSIGQWRGLAQPKRNVDEPAEGKLDLERLKHSDLRIVSPIDVVKWDRAGWNAIFFVTAPGSWDAPPVLGLAFRNREMAENIFRGLRSRFGLDDRDGGLRIAIVRGSRISNPHAYSVVVGPNVDKLELEQGTTFGFVQRVHLMQPKDSKNLEGFLAEYRRYGRYLLAPVYLPAVDQAPELLIDLSLGKHDLVVRDAWQISDRDFDMQALDHNDPPVVPLGVADPPVLKALSRIQSFRERGQ